MKTFWDDIPFERKEFVCSCGCGFDCVDAELLDLLLRLRQVFGTVIISGGNRCVEHNEVVQKIYNKLYVPYSSKSYHTRGMAVDAKFPNTHPRDVYNYLVANFHGKYGFILYHNRVHIDVRQTPYRKIKRK